MVSTASPPTDRRVERIKRRLTIPVLLAAMVSVPAVFLARMDGHLASAGEVLNWASLIVLTGESAILFFLAGNRIAWLRTHMWMVGITLAAIPAVILSIGPVQALRAIQVVFTLQVLRAGRILRAGRVLQRRMGLDGVWGNTVTVMASLIAAGFVTIILADPNSNTRMLVRDLSDTVDLGVVLLAATILAVATVIVLVNRRR